MTPSQGLLFGLPLLTASIILVIWLISKAESIADSLDIGTKIVQVTGVIVVFVLLLVGFIGYWPLKTEYHFWKNTEGQVTDINSRLIGPNGGETKYVVTLEGIGERGCNDTRCATVKVGDKLTLKCKRVYQWGGTPGYDCNFVRNEKS